MRNTVAMAAVLSLLLAVPAFCEVKPSHGKVDAKGTLKPPVYTWKQNRSRVVNDIEKKYDLNTDGWIDPAEARAMFNERLYVIHAYGKAVVNSPLEAEYDANKDGILDSTEAVALKQSLEQ